jgi:hypothetical protein
VKTIAVVSSVAVLVIACGGEKPAAESTPAPVPPPVQAPPPDRIGAAPATATDTSAKPKADTSKKAAAKGAGAMRDSAFGPTYAVDSTGKVTKLKKP